MNDLFNRKDLSDVMTRLVSHSEDSFVLALNAPWGTGKTTFLKMWEHHLRSEGFACIYFNAWESDYAADPLTCLVGEVSSLLASMGPESKAKPLFDRTKKLGAKVLKRTIPVAARVLSAGLIDGEAMKDIEQAVSGLAEKVAADAIEEHEKGKTLSREFRKALENAVRAISEEASPEQPKPLIFVIDELDRCRPTFAIELLERAKHFFTVPGVVFVLGIDRQALSTSLQTVYGTGFDAFAYLRRFIDFELRLSPASNTAFVSSLIVRFGLKSYADFYEDRMGEHDYLQNRLSSFMAASSMSLRAQEQAVARLGVICRMARHDTFYTIVVVPLLVLMETEAELFGQFTAGTLDGRDLLTRWAKKRPEIGELFSKDEHGRRCATILEAACSLMRGEDEKTAIQRLFPRQAEESDAIQSKRDEFIEFRRHLGSRRSLEQTFIAALNLAAKFRT